MTPIQINAEILRNMSIVVEDEGLTRKLAKYLRKLVASKQNDPTLMTEEQFLSRVDEAKKGTTYRMNADEDLTSFLRRLGNDL